MIYDRQQPGLFDEIERELPPETPQKSHKINAAITLDCGKAVSFRFDRYWARRIVHIEFYGESISETGYRSYFSPIFSELQNDDNNIVVERIKQIAESLHKDHLEFLNKQNKKQKGLKK